MPLMVAAGSPDGATAETVRVLLDLHANPLVASGCGSAAAMAAGGLGWGYVPGGDAGRLSILLEAGCDPNETIPNGQTLVALAASTGDHQRVKVLLDKGARPDPGPVSGHFGEVLKTSVTPEVLRAIQGDTSQPQSFQIPLFEAARSGSADCIRLLIAAGAKANSRDQSGNTALMNATTSEAVEALLSAGTDRRVTNQWGHDALHEILDKGSDGDSLSHSLKDAARALIRAGEEVDRRDKYGHTRLYSFAFRRNPDAVRLLLESGADIGTVQGQQGTPLHGVAWQGEMEGEKTNRGGAQVIELLVSQGNSLEARDSKGWTPLHQAADGDWASATAIRTLLRLGADPDPVDPQGQTPLMLAADGGEIECIKLLLAAGADPSRRDSHGLSPLDRARKHLERWRQITKEGRRPEVFDRLNVTQDRLRASQEKALREAEETLGVIQDAVDGRSSTT